ncbi:unnamed protein product [Peniophora sp. CBMAI 1063]|nr:unnamed protein product [Peniophora sp. CBMAI 1063]
MLSFRKLFVRPGKSQSRDAQSGSQLSQTGFASPMRPPLERRRTPYPRRRRRFGSSSTQSSIPFSSGRAGYSPSDAVESSESDEVPESYHGLPRLLFDAEVERCLAALEFQTDAVWSRLEEEENNIIRMTDPELDLLSRRFEEALASDLDDSDVRAGRVRVQGTMSRRLALKKRLGF